MIWMDVDIALSEVPVNVAPLTDDTDFKAIEAAVAYNASGMALYWHFVTTGGAYTATAVTPTSGGVYDWNHQQQGMYTIEIPASGGASINNDTEGFGWFTGFCTGVLPWRGPTIGFRAAGLNDLLTDSAYSTTRGLAGTALPAAAAEAAGGLYTRGTGAGQINQAANGQIDVNAERLNNVAQSLLDLKDFADDGYDPSTNKIAGLVLADAVTIVNGLAANVITAAAAAADFGAELQALITGGAYALATDANGRIRIVDGTGTGELDTLSGTVLLRAATQASIDAIEVDTSTTLQGELDGIQTDTEDIQSRLPAALVNSRMDCTIDGTGMETGAVDAILNRDASGSTTNSTLGAIINDWENGGRLDLLVDAILDDTGTSGVVLNAAGLATDAVEELRNAITGGAYALSTDSNGRVRVVDGTGAGEINTNAGAIALVDLVTTTTTVTNLHASAATAAELAKVPKSDSNVTWNATALASIQGECDDALVGRNLDHLLHVAVDTDFPTTVHLNSVLGHLADNGTAASFDRTTDSLEAFRNEFAGVFQTVTFPANFGSLSISAFGNVDANVVAMDADVMTADAAAADFVEEIRNAITGGAYALNTSATGSVRVVDGTGTDELNTSGGNVTVGTNNDKTGYAITGDAATAGTRLLTMIELDGSVYRYTTNALEQAPAGGGGGGGTDWTADEREAIRTILGFDSDGDLVALADGALFDIKAKTDLIGTGAVTFAGVVSATGGIDEIVIGSSYLNADGRALAWADTGLTFPSFADGSCTLAFYPQGESTATLTVSGTVVDANTVRFDLTSANTTTLSAKVYGILVNVTLAGGNVITFVRSTARVKSATE